MTVSKSAKNSGKTVSEEDLGVKCLTGSSQQVEASADDLERPQADSGQPRGRRKKRLPTADDNWRALKQQLNTGQAPRQLHRSSATSSVSKQNSDAIGNLRDSGTSNQSLGESVPAASPAQVKPSPERHRSSDRVATSVRTDGTKQPNDTEGSSLENVRAELHAPEKEPLRKAGPLGLYPQERAAPLGSIIALDGEFVGIGPGGSTDALARISVVDYDEAVLYDRFVQVDTRVVDFRTPYSGIQPHHLQDPSCVPFAEAQRAVASLMKGRIIVGHELRKDLTVLQLSHPRRHIRDTAHYLRLRRLLPMRTFRTPSLRTLAAELLDQVIQKGTAHGPGHDSVEDATTALRIYKLMADIWERDLVKMEKQQQQRAAARSTKKQKRRAARLRSAEKAERQAKSSKGSNPDTEQRLRSSGSPSSESPKEKQLLENADDSTGTRSVPAFVDVAS